MDIVGLAADPAERAIHSADAGTSAEARKRVEGVDRIDERSDAETSGQAAGLRLAAWDS